MITLFSEEVEVTSTNSDRNTIFVESYEEVFFGVYEFEINGSTVIAEKVGEYEMEPVVAIPVVEADGNKTEVHFDLRRGEFEVKLGVGKAVLTEEAINTVVEEDLKEVVAEQAKTIIENNTDQREINISYQLDREGVVNEIKTDLEATLNELRNETKDIVDDVERIRDEIFIEFTSNSDNYRAKESEKLRAFIDTKLDTIKKDNKVLAEKLEKFVSSTLDKEYGVFVSRVRDTHDLLKKRELENKKIAAQLIALEKSQIELNDANNNIQKQVVEATEAADKNVNKALSRLGTVKKELTDSKEQFDTIKEQLAFSIDQAEERVKLYYHEKIRQAEQSVFKNIRREEILETIKKSKAMILAELNNTNGLKDQLRQLATEAANGEYDPISGKRFQDQLKRDLNKKFADEMVNIKRMIELAGGGGGIGDAPNDGNTYSRQNGKWVLGGGGGPGGGSDVSALSGNWESTWTTVQTYSADWFGGSGTLSGDTLVLSGAEGESTLSAGSDGLFVSSGMSVQGDTTIQGNLSVLGDLTYIDTTVSVTSALSVINNGTGPAFYAEQSGVGEPIAIFKDTEGGQTVIDDGGNVGIGTSDPAEKLTVNGNISANGNLSAGDIYGDSLTVSGNVNGTNIETLTNNVSALYSYLVGNFSSNQITTATDINDFVTNYPKTGIEPGDIITLSATNTVYLLGDNDGSALTDWYEVNLKPNFLFYKQGLADYSVLDTIALSSVNSTKYIVEVKDKSDGALFYGEISVVSDGTIAMASEYALNYTTVFPFVEFGAEVVGGTHIQLSAVALESKDMGNFVFKGNRVNLFG